jgi:hypothetical protein
VKDKDKKKSDQTGEGEAPDTQEEVTPAAEIIEVEAVEVEEVKEEKPVTVKVGSLKPGDIFQYGGGEYSVVSHRIICEDLKTHSRGEIDSGQLVTLKSKELTA